jgi:hypothetical protein
MNVTHAALAVIRAWPDEPHQLGLPEGWKGAGQLPT